MSSMCRLYLRGSAGHRKFYWVELADDMSLYIGSSNGGLFTYGYAGVAASSQSVEPIIPARDGRVLSTREIGAKTSFHGSGVVNLSTEEDGRCERVHISAPRDGFEALPLVAVMPMLATRYPLSQKTIKPIDLCLPECLQYGMPVGVLIYLSASMAHEPAPITAAKQRMRLAEVHSCPLGSVALQAFVYSDPEQLRAWPMEEVQVVAHPSTQGGEPTWPFFA